MTRFLSSQESSIDLAGGLRGRFGFFPAQSAFFCLPNDFSLELGLQSWLTGRPWRVCSARLLDRADHLKELA